MASASPEFAGNRLIIFISIFTPLQAALVGLRFYSRTLTARPYSTDDWLVVASLIGQIIQAGASIAGVKQGGIGYHVGYLAETDPQAITTFFQYLVFYSAWYFATMALPKLAICVLYRRLFPQRTVLIVLLITSGILIGTATASFIADLAACRPFEANWAPAAVQATHCLDKEPLFVWSSFPNIITDLVMLVLPLPIVWKLHTTTQLKIALTGTFLVGSMGLVAAILRFRTFADNNSFIDPTYTAVELLIWTLAEPGIYLISACLLLCRPLLEKFGRKIGSGVGSSGGTAANSRRARGAYGYGGSSGPSNSRSGGRKSSKFADGGGGGGGENSSIALGSIVTTARGFQQLPDEAAEDPRAARAFSQGNVVVTTHIDQSWA